MRPLAFVVLLTAAAGCASTRAQVPLAPQPLEVPPVPPRVIVPEIEEVVLLPADPAPPSKPAPQRPDPPGKPPESTSGTTTAEPPRPGAADTRAGDPPRVRTPETANAEAAERDVRAIMARAQGSLQNVRRQSLSQPAQQQYDIARRFLAQAENALKSRNYVFARNLAEKAETLARQLGK